MKNNRMSLKKLLAILLLVIICGSIQARMYVVYSVIGSVTMKQNGRTQPLTVRKYVSSDTQVTIPPESAVTLIDEKDMKMFSFTKAGTNRVADLVNTTTSKKSLSRQYMSYLVKQLFSPISKKMSHPDTYMQVAGTSYRAVSSDSLLANSVVQAIIGDKVRQNTTEQMLLQPDHVLRSDLDVSFDLVSCTTNKVIDPVLEKNSACYVRVRNNTQETLYVNIFNIDCNGNKYLVLPLDEEATCANLLVPAACTVAFKQEPFLFSDQTSRDAFVMVATEEPVNFSILMSPIRSNGNGGMKLGIYRKFYETR